MFSELPREVYGIARMENMDLIQPFIFSSGNWYME